MQDVVYVNTPDKQQHGLVSCIQAEGLKPTLLFRQAAAWFSELHSS